MKLMDRDTAKDLIRLHGPVGAVEYVAAQYQAKIDALMAEFTPEEMSEEQLENWAQHQVPYVGEDA